MSTTFCLHGKGDPPMDCAWPDCESYCGATAATMLEAQERRYAALKETYGEEIADKMMGVKS